MMTTETFEFDLIFALPGGDAQDEFALADAVFAAGFDDAVVGSGTEGLLAVALDHEGPSAEEAILDAARKLLTHLPKGTVLREVRPDLVSLAEVAKRLDVKRQALQKRKMPLPAMSGLFRADEIGAMLSHETRGKIAENMEQARRWFAAAGGAKTINASLALNRLDPASLELTEKSVSGVKAAG